MSAERLQKALAQAGLGSRRKCEDLIRAGRVRVNGSVALLGSSADPAVDDIRVDGARLVIPSEFTYIALYKPVGVVSSLRAQGNRQTVVDLVDVRARLYPVGRLDVDSEGLVLLTNDGQVANRLTHPRYGHEKEYRVLVAPAPGSEQLEAWRRGITLEDGKRARPARVTVEKKAGDAAWVRVVMQEGRKRQIRDTARLLGMRVQRLVRVRVGEIGLGGLQPGEWRRLTRREIRQLQVASGGTGKAGSPARSGHARGQDRGRGRMEA